MPHIPLSELKSGMLVVRHVRDRSGRMLVREGSRIDARILRVLRSWGVSGVEVAESEAVEQGSAGAALDGVVDEATLRAIEAQLDHTFRHVDQTLGVARALRRICAGRMAAERGAG